MSPFALATLAVLVPACSKFDTSRTLPERGTVGEEMFGVICDRVGAQVLTEDLSGASFHDICHKSAAGTYASVVDQAALPAIATGVNVHGQTVTMAAQQQSRSTSVGRIEALARRRADLIRAFDATFPKETVAIKDLDNADETKSCSAAPTGGQGSFPTAVADWLGRMGPLYNDGTLPNSTESLSRVVDDFKNLAEAQAAWARMSGRQGYYPIDTALGPVRPVVAYPNLRDLSNASLSLLSADSQPFSLNPKYDDTGARIPVPGPGNAALNQLLAAAQSELLDVTVDPALPPLVTTTDPATGRVLLSRPRDNLEIASQVVFVTDDSFGNNPPNYIVKRDSRGYAALAGGGVPSPFVDSDGDGLPDVDDTGQFVTSDNSVAPTPFPNSGTVDNVTRDPYGRPLVNGQLLYDYIDTSRTAAARVMTDLLALVNPDPAANHETLMNLLAGAYVTVGPRVKATKTYANAPSVSYDGIGVDSPILDLVYAAGVMLGDRNTDATLAMAHDLIANQPMPLARAVGDLLTALDIAKTHTEAKIPPTSTYWDDTFDIMGQIAQEPGLLEDLLRAIADPATEQIGQVYANDAHFKDSIVYNINDLNGPPWNETTNSAGEMVTPVDRSAPQTGSNRSALTRWMQLVADTTGVTKCNKEGAVVHVKYLGLPLTMPLSLSNVTGIGGPTTYKECEVYILKNLGGSYVDAMVNAAADPALGRNNETPPPGTIYMRNDTLRNGVDLVLFHLGATTVDILQNSCGITNFWTDTSSKVLAPKPEWLSRYTFFDFQNDNVNTTTKTYLEDAEGEHTGSSVCPERIIDDPNPTAVDAWPDGKIHGLRDCPDGEWLEQRQHGTIFTFEHFGFFDAVRPLLSAFVKHKREDLYLALNAATYKHFPDASASYEECRVIGGGPCPRDGANSYEPIIVDTFATDIVPAVSELVRTINQMPIVRCDAANANGSCTAAGSTAITGVDVMAAATRAALDPNYAKNTLKLVDRNGKSTTTRNDGTLVPQVTPMYLVTNALDAIDTQYAAYEAQHPDDTGRHAAFQQARSQLADQFLAITGSGSTAAFKNPTITKLGPTVVDLLRSQLLANCPNSFSPPYARCDWALDTLPKKAQDMLTGPLAATSLEVADVVRRDPEGRKQIELLLQYLLDSASPNAAQTGVLAFADDIVQLLRDEQNLVPLAHLAASAFGASVKDSSGHITQKSFVDAQMALLSRTSGRYYNAGGTEICAREVDPNQVLAVALKNLVTPINDGDFKGQAPIQVILDVAADVNRVDPTQPYGGTLAKSDYANVSDEVVDFLTNKEHGLEQFYEVIRQGTK
ncbi:MAG: hypothetical protein FWD73_02545 [Polyangiaceae bacterium]|nr:hypothetical protein [Polyangiaceae bacterium]